MKFRQYFLAAVLALAGTAAAHADEVPSGLFEVEPLPDLPVWWFHGAEQEPSEPIPVGSIAGPEGIIDGSAIAAVPEPQTYALLGAGLLLIGAMRRRQRHHR